jgi:NitT/TauT family transport system substrate-binding protein
MLPMSIMQTRRRFLTTASIAGGMSLLSPVRAVAADPPLETIKLRLTKLPTICVAPQYAAEQLLHSEGFPEVEYVDVGTGAAAIEAIGRGEVDFGINFAATQVTALDANQPITLLCGVHVGCFELFGREGIDSVAQLAGRKVAVPASGSSSQSFLSATAAHVGLDPIKDIRWLPSPSAVELFANGEADAFLGIPPATQELRARHVGRVIVNSALDRPWSQYFCCLLAGNREFVEKHPGATRRVLRAILKATDLCVTDPIGVAQRLVEHRFTPNYQYALQTLNELPYDKWREYDPEDTVRFYALRLRDVGLVKSTPQRIITEGTDWHFLNELKRELKA